MTVKKVRGTKATIVLALVIILSGYFMSTLIYKFMPSYKNTVKEVKNVTVARQLFDISDEEQLSVYPWNIYNKERTVKYTDYPKDKVRAIGNMMDLIKKFLGISNIEIYDLKKQIWDKSQWLITDEVESSKTQAIENDPIFVINDIFTTSSLPSNYTIKFSVDEEEYMSFMVHKRKGTTVTLDSMKVSEKILQSQASTMESNLRNYLEALRQISEEEKLDKLGDSVDTVLNYGLSGNISYDIFSSESELLLVYSLDNGITLVLYFDPIIHEFIGFNLQQS